MKTCTMCGEEKPVDQFRKQKGRKERANCKECDVARHKEWARKNREHLREYGKTRYREKIDKWAQHILRKYNLTPTDYDALLQRQGSACAICGEGNPHNKQGRFNIDHCHKTGRVRGLLCWRCNVAIGKMMDDPHRLRMAATYLEQSLPSRHKRSSKRT